MKEMKANELMVGDFVFHEKYGNAIIETIDNDFGDNPYVKLISENIKHKDGYKYGYCWCDLNEIFSIPLTPEILEKNEFKNIRDNEVFLLNKISSNVNLGIYFDSNNIHIYLQNNNSGSWPGYEYYELFDIKYVHELQHALKLCGIEKTIEL